MLEKFKRVRDDWNEVRIKSLCFNNIRLHQKNKARTYINNVDKGIKPLPPERHLLDF